MWYPQQGAVSSLLFKQSSLAVLHLVLDALAGDVEVLGLDLDADELAAEAYAGDASCSNTHIRVANRCTAAG